MQEGFSKGRFTKICRVPHTGGGSGDDTAIHEGNSFNTANVYCGQIRQGNDKAAWPLWCHQCVFETLE